MKRRVAWILLAVVALLNGAWGGLAAAIPYRLLGPHGTPVLSAGYEGYSGGSWAQLAAAAPGAPSFIALLFRMYGLYCFVIGALGVVIATTAFRRGERWAWWALLFGNVVPLVAAMAYDRSVRAIGPFEITEYVGLALVFIALAITVPSRALLNTQTESAASSSA